MTLKLSVAEQKAKSRAYWKMIDETKARVDNAAPRLTPEIYIKSKALVKQSTTIQNQIQSNLSLIARINVINRSRGKVNCWEYPKDRQTFKLLRRVRTLHLRKIAQRNQHIYKLLQKAKTTIPPKVKSLPPVPSKDATTAARDTEANSEPLDSNVQNIPSLNKYWLEFETDGEVGLGKMVVELFDKMCPVTCQLFRKLVRGSADGRAYGGTRVYLIVPDMFCQLGDVVDNDGFGELVQEEKLSIPENYSLNHYCKGIVSMHVHNGFINGMFNITFRPMPLLDGKAVVFGKVTSGLYLLDMFNAMGTQSGLVAGKLFINQCGWFSKANKLQRGLINTKLPEKVQRKKPE